MKGVVAPLHGIPLFPLWKRSQIYIILISYLMGPSYYFSSSYRLPN